MRASFFIYEKHRNLSRVELESENYMVAKKKKKKTCAPLLFQRKSDQTFAPGDVLSCPGVYAYYTVVCVRDGRGGGVGGWGRRSIVIVASKEPRRIYLVR